MIRFTLPPVLTPVLSGYAAQSESPFGDSDVPVRNREHDATSPISQAPLEESAVADFPRLQRSLEDQRQTFRMFDERRARELLSGGNYRDLRSQLCPLMCIQDNLLDAMGSIKKSATSGERQSDVTVLLTSIAEIQSRIESALMSLIHYLDTTLDRDFDGAARDRTSLYERIAFRDLITQGLPPAAFDRERHKTFAYYKKAIPDPCPASLK